MANEPDAALRETPLAPAHRALGAKMVPFAGYAMPVQYPTGILAEHLWTRAEAGLFDVSHMGQFILAGPDAEAAARALEALVPADILGLAPGQQRYTQLLDGRGGILDDLMVSRLPAPDGEGQYALVVNASRKAADAAHIAAHLAPGITLRPAEDHALLALQGPKAVEVLAAVAPEVAGLRFMRTARLALDGIPVLLSRSGYTGEDGFEIACPAGQAPALWARLLADPRVKPIGLGARDSLRLEAGLCLYGHDIDPATSPVEAGLAWSIPKRRRAEGGFPGAERIARDLSEGPARSRVGLVPEGRAPAREGTPILDPETGADLGLVTSGGFGPSVNGPIAMGYVPTGHARPGTAVHLLVRGKPLPARVVALPFHPHAYAR